MVGLRAAPTQGDQAVPDGERGDGGRPHLRVPGLEGVLRPAVGLRHLEPAKVQGGQRVGRRRRRRRRSAAALIARLEVRRRGTNHGEGPWGAALNMCVCVCVSEPQG